MIFNSVTYLLFLVLVVSLYWALPRRPRLWLILVASLGFYAFWRPPFVLVMLVSAFTDYFIGLALARTQSEPRRKLLVVATLVVNLGLLLYFKYLYFVVENVWAVAGWLGVGGVPPVLDIVLPLGISFYTFQTISYSVDVYRRQIEPVRDPVLYLSFVTFFPQLVAGPILRAGELVHQLDVRPAFRTDSFASGLRRIGTGLFLKVGLADNIAPMVDGGFAQPIATLSAIDVWTLAFLFGLQIYFDFCGYSHIAIGSSRLMGIHLPENFDFPYSSASPREFWRRWHISLSSWIRDYLYLPLMGVRVHARSTGGLPVAGAGARAPGARPNFALFMSWSLMGLWHGASWAFLMWGVYHACAIAIYRALPAWVQKLPQAWRTWLGFGITLPAMMLSWIPFRAGGVQDALAMFARVLTPSAYLSLGMRENVYLVAFLLTALTLLAHPIGRWVERLEHSRPRYAAAVDFAAAAAVTPLIFVFLRPISQFIYFQF